MLNASDDWKLAFVAAILGEGQIAKLASHAESQGIANMLSDRAEDIRLAEQEHSLAFADWDVV